MVKIGNSSFWGHFVAGNHLYVGTTQGELIKMDKELKVIKRCELCKKNIYSVVCNDSLIYTVSQDMTIKTVNADSFETVYIAKKAVGGMATILGVCNDYLVVADSNKISIWDIPTLIIREKFDFPTGQYNKGTILCGNRLFGSDNQSIYTTVLE